MWVSEMAEQVKAPAFMCEDTKGWKGRAPLSCPLSCTNVCTRGNVLPPYPHSKTVYLKVKMHVWLGSGGARF